MWREQDGEILMKKVELQGCDYVKGRSFGCQGIDGIRYVSYGKLEKNKRWWQYNN